MHLLYISFTIHVLATMPENCSLGTLTRSNTKQTNTISDVGWKLEISVIRRGDVLSVHRSLNLDLRKRGDVLFVYQKKQQRP